MNNKKKSIHLTKFSSFDYSEVEGNPELKIKVEFLNKMLSRIPDKNNKRVLEVGIGAGETTNLLLNVFKKVVVVEPNGANCDKLLKKLEKRNLSNLKIIKSKIENANLSNKKFDNIILSCVLEHLIYPVPVLKKLSASLNEGGTIHIIIGQANSLHRLLGVKEGVIANTEDLSPTDIKLGHYRVYTPKLLHEQIETSGLKISFEKSFYLKPLTISILSEISTDTHRALSSLGEDFPGLACYIYVEATRKDFKIEKRE